MLDYKQPHVLFALSALIGFTLQGFVSNTGALSVIFPNLPFPIPYINGRTFHASIGIYWTFFGLVGGIFYFFRAEIEKAHLTKPINALFWILAPLVVALQGALVLRYPIGREYIEGPYILRLALAVPLLLLIYYLSKLYQISKGRINNAAPFCILAGANLIFFSYVTTVVLYKYSALEQLSQFLIFHVFSEMGAELMAIALASFLIVELIGRSLKSVDTAMILALVLAAASGTLALLQYFIWPGNKLLFVLLAASFSGFHVLPVLLLVYEALSGFTLQAVTQLGQRKLLTSLLLSGSVFYHLFAAGMLGLFLAYPDVYRYLHGSYASSAHSHQALFGAFGLLSLALAVYILFERAALCSKDVKRASLAFAIFNAGMMTMGAMLLVAGGLQIYFITVLGTDGAVAEALVRPYLFGRTAGGILYTTGSLFFSYVLITRLWAQRIVFIEPTGRISFTGLQQAYIELLDKQKEIESLLRRIEMIFSKLTMLRREHKK